jgi:hypothetical protein
MGVLSTVQDSSNYRLRSPNLVHLMGTCEEVSDRLITIGLTTPPGGHALESCHAKLTSDAYSPLTFSQEQILNSQQSGVALIFGTPATGLQLIEHALQRLVPESGGEFGEIRVAAQNGTAIKLQLEKFVQDHTKARYLIACRELDGNPGQMVEQIDIANRYCKQIRSKTLRVFFILNPQSAWQWFSLPKKVRESIEERLDTIISLKRWDKVGIKQRIEMETWDGEGIIASERLIGKTLEVTGGYPFLMDQLFLEFDVSDPQNTIEVVKKLLQSSEDKTRHAFIRNLGIYDTLPRKMIQVLLNEDANGLLQTGLDPLEVFADFIKDEQGESLESTLGYLKRLELIASEGHLALDPIIAKLWLDE